MAECKSIEFNTTLKAQALTAWGYCYFMLYLIPLLQWLGKRHPNTHTTSPHFWMAVTWSGQQMLTICWFHRSCSPIAKYTTDENHCWAETKTSRSPSIQATGGCKTHMDVSQSWSMWGLPWVTLITMLEQDNKWKADDLHRREKATATKAWL